MLKGVAIEKDDVLLVLVNLALLFTLALFMRADALGTSDGPRGCRLLVRPAIDDGAQSIFYRNFDFTLVLASDVKGLVAVLKYLQLVQVS